MSAFDVIFSQFGGNLLANMAMAIEKARTNGCDCEVCITLRAGAEVMEDAMTNGLGEWRLPDEPV